MLHRRDVVKTLLDGRSKNLLAVAGLGSSAWDLSAAGDNKHNFCFIGAMGQAAPFALGLALAQSQKQVVLFTGDGDMLMSVGALATIANQSPQNLTLIVLDNEAYFETGGQVTATAGCTDLTAMARGAGFEQARTITQADELPALRTAINEARGPTFACIKIVAEKLPLVFPHSFDGVTAINRFREAATTAPR